MFIRGLPVKNAKKGLKIAITAGDVKSGGVKTPSSCAAARSLCRVPNISEALVHLSVTYVREKDAKHWWRFMTPASLRQEIITFDHGGKFHPGEFNLHKPHKALGEAQGSNTSRNRPQHLQKARSARHVITDVRPHATTERDNPKHLVKGA